MVATIPLGILSSIGSSGIGSAGAGAGMMSSLGSLGGLGSMHLGGQLEQLVPQLFQGLVSRKQSKHDRNRAEAFALMMRSTAYQSTVRDLRKAGLNPMLAYTKGPTYSSPGPMAEPMGRAVADVGKGLASAKQFMAIQDELKTIAANRRAAEAGAKTAETEQKFRKDLLHTQIGSNLAAQLLAEDNALRARAERDLTRVETEIRKKDVPRAEIVESLWSEANKMFKAFEDRVRAITNTPTFDIRNYKEK